MTAKQLREQYSDYWENVEASVMDDMNLVFNVKKNDDSEFVKKRETVAYNAAFIATYEHHKIMEHQKQVVAAK